MTKQPFFLSLFLASVSTNPGVYIFYDNEGRALYVGKAKNLKKRVQIYFRDTGLTPKTRFMVSKIAKVETQQTRTESEALFLENNLIKNKKPRYNISLRDDKTFPYIRLTDERFPRFSFYRGVRSQPGQYFGPYPNAAAIRKILGYLYKIFKLRQCNDTFFHNRSRPCLQYQIKRCSAPCVNHISQEDYLDDIRQAKAMLIGQDHSLIQELADKMEKSSAKLEFKTAAIYRDRIALLQRCREKQYISSDIVSDADVIAVAMESGIVCFGVISIRQGQNFGGRFHVQTNSLGLDAGALLEAFLPQNYLGNAIPQEILLSDKIERHSQLQQAFSFNSGKKVKIKHQCRARRARWVESASINTRDHLRRHLNEQSQINTQFIALTKLLALEKVLQRIECFDISHTMGERTVGSCVVFNHQGAVKSDYRRFNITGIQPGDDYAAMEQILIRRYKRVKDYSKLPDLVILDGGKGQLSVAKGVFAELQILGFVIIMGVSKGPDRRAGRECFHLIDLPRAIIPPRTSSALHLVQRIRDEAHRFAITCHRKRRAKARTNSPLEEIEGIGDKRRRSLLRYFGGLQEIKRAGIEDLSMVHGISLSLAEKIYTHFHQ